LPKKAYPPGTIVGLSKGDPVPFDGILMNEDRANDVAQLRISYDELVTVAATNQRLFVATARISDEELRAADARAKSLEPTWWDRHALAVGFIGGLVLSGAFTVAVLGATQGVR
jgi:hypothetical protein